METGFLQEALFAGQTGNGFKLGTALTVGWFWPRVGGCSVLYRGESMEAIDFADILAVADAAAGRMVVPGYLPHESGSIYFYVIRGVNNCGDQEHSLSAAVKVSIGADGELAGPAPNKVFEAKACRVGGNRIRLVWFYCPVGQQSRPACFKIYYDGGTGQIDYEEAIAVIGYAGQRFYSYTSGALDAGEYLFCIRAEDAVGTEGGSLAQIRIQLDSASPDAVEILGVESV